jgi:TonB family protein
MTPWTILGIKAGSDRDTIRRAYARKLKGVNPEDDPGGFMRLREAHDAALAQLQWRQRWPEPDENAEDAEPDAADWAVAPAPLMESSDPLPMQDDEQRDDDTALTGAETPSSAAPARDAELADLAVRRQAFLDAMAAGPDGQVAAFEHLLAAPALEGISARDRIEGWIANAIRTHLPASDPLVVAAITHFGWGEIGSAARGDDVAVLLQRREEGEFVARIARPHADLNQGYKALSRPVGARWLARIGALFGGVVPGQTRQILALADGPMPGIADWLNGDAMAFWREWHTVPRLRLWMILTMFPLAAAALVPVLAATGWPEPVQMIFGVTAYGAPFALLWLLRFRQRFLADWERPDWQYRAWLFAAPALPVVAALWPPVGALAPIWLVIVTCVTALTLVSVNRLLPDAPKTLMIGLIRAWPAWFFLAVLLIGAPVPVWAKPVLGLLVLAMAIIWWQGGDELVWAAEQRLGRWSPWLLTGAAAALASSVGPLLLASTPDPGWAARALAVMVLAMLLAVMAFRSLQGWTQWAPALVMLGLMLVTAAGLEGLRPDTGRPVPPPRTPPQALGTVDQWLDPGPLLRGQPPGAYRFRIAITVDERGRVRACSLEQGTGVPALDKALCPQLQAKARYRPARDAKDVAVSTGLRLTGGWTVRRPPALAPAGVSALPPPALSPPPSLPRRAEPVIRCTATTGTGPMVAEPCMREAWIGDGDYPAAAQALGQSGTVEYRLLIDAQGRVERCDVTGSSGHAALDKGTCDLIRRRARFVPARGADGQPMEWAYRSGVDWVLSQR